MTNTGDDWRTPPPAPAGEDVRTHSVVTAVRMLAERVGVLIELITHNDTYRRWIIGMLAANLVALIVIAGAGVYAFNRLSDVQRTLINCTTASTPEHRHVCYERSQNGTAAAVNRIVDTNGNGIPDTQELLANQAAAAAQRGITLPYTLTPSTTTTTTHR